MRLRKDHFRALEAICSRITCHVDLFQVSKNDLKKPPSMRTAPWQGMLGAYHAIDIAVFDKQHPISLPSDHLSHLLRNILEVLRHRLRQVSRPILAEVAQLCRVEDQREYRWLHGLVHQE